MTRYRFGILIVLGLLSALAAAGNLLPEEKRPLLTEPGSWKSFGNINRVEPDEHFVYSDGPDALYWMAPRNIGNGAGLLVSRSFPGPPWISLTITGNLERPGNDVYFRRVGQERRLRIGGRTETFIWRRVTVGLPSDWVGQPVELIVEAAPGDKESWFGLSNPTATGWNSVLASQLRVLAVLPAFVVALVLFLLPGLPGALYLVGRGPGADLRVVPVTIVFSSLAGYLTFWAYFCHWSVGIAFGGAVLLGSAGYCAVVLVRSPSTRALLLSGEVATSFQLTALVGLFYLSLWYSIDLHVPFALTPRLRMFEFTLALDNVIPYYFAERLLHAVPPQGTLLGEWHFSDRPPLQAGLLLLQLPIGYLVRQPENYSLIAGCALQCAWVPAIRFLWLTAGMTPRRAGLALLLVTATGFCLVNTVFTWPKMLSAALCLIAVTLAIMERSSRNRLSALWMGLAVALAFLAHGGVAFTLIPVALFLLLPRYFPGIAGLLIAGAAACLLVLPWALFQRYYDPPGDELIRQHLGDHGKPRVAAGSSETTVAAWVSSRPLWQNLVDAYAGLSTEQILQNKLMNLVALFRASPRPADDQYPWPPFGAPDPWPVDSTALRRCEFLCLFWAPGLLNLGWLVGLASIRRRSWRLNPDLALAAPGLGLASAALWIVLMFGPGSTVIHQGSYAMVLLLLAALGAWLCMLPGWLPYFLLAAQGGLFTTEWLLTSPANPFGTVNGLMVASALAAGAGLVRVALGSTELHGPAVTAVLVSASRRPNLKKQEQL